MFTKYLSLNLFAFSLLTAFLALLKSKRFNTKGNLFLSGVLIVYGLFWVEFVFGYFGVKLDDDSIFINSVLSIAEMSFYYVSVLHFTSLRINYKEQKKWFLLPVVLLLLIIILQVSLPSYDYFGLYLTIVFSGLYGCKSYILLNRHQKQIGQFSSNEKEVDLQWIKNIALAILFLLLFQIGLLIFNAENTLAAIFPMLHILFVMYLFYNIESQIEVYPIKQYQKEELFEAIEKPKKKLLTDTTLEIQKQKLIKKLSEEKLYLDNELNLVKLAELMNVPVHQMSYLINSGFNENFSSFINRYRVEFAKELLKDKTTKFSILGIALESGFNSKTAFYNAFKKQTNLSPSEFKNLHSA